eukprot:scaffold246081_cov21-Tisochrysis_lutea.AAC.1
MGRCPCSTHLGSPISLELNCVQGGGQIVMDTIGWQDLKVEVTQHNVTEVSLAHAMYACLPPLYPERLLPIFNKGLHLSYKSRPVVLTSVANRLASLLCREAQEALRSVSTSPPAPALKIAIVRPLIVFCLLRSDVFACARVRSHTHTQTHTHTHASTRTQAHAHTRTIHTQDFFSSGSRSHLHRLLIDVPTARILSCTRLLRRTLEFPTMNLASTAQAHRHAYFASDDVDDEVAWAPAQ